MQGVVGRYFEDGKRQSVNMSGEREGTVKNNTKAHDLCGDRYGGVSNENWTDISFWECGFSANEE